MKKIKLDELLVERGLSENIDKAKRMIMAGQVFSEQERLDKPGMKVKTEIPLHIKGKKLRYVGRGGLKLEKALKYFDISVKDKILIDIGSSTGGFTDCALQFGASMSYAIDVGYNQLDWKLRNDERVVVMERTNFRYVTKDMLKKGFPNLASIDVSFISLKQMLPVLKTLLTETSDVVTLIKPQFEAKREQVGEKGIVRDRLVHMEVIEEMIRFTEKEGFTFVNLTYSPITGGEGNIEFLAHFVWKKEIPPNNIDIKAIVDEAHLSLIKGEKDE
ncbi:TlyA family RNA methyltransferase [Oceanobacillus piezotolerans]|uniref:TlyA family RNA methyltransferase n=1 Tax=Oceanobacillus piezotolerans TaxID=2448030 RepID=A0A498DD23_9BACI|nr:TlyA family RNA methyltransferase [Oceanobacillus piezotolerans]RLL48122.1 TlyA family RNA methyltransferase [Oceanobacillus piezotolerans]